MPPIHFSVTVVEFAPLAAGRLLEHVGLHVRDGAAALDHLELLEQLLLLHHARLRIDRIRLLGACGVCADRQREEREGTDDDPKLRGKHRHLIFSLFDRLTRVRRRSLIASRPTARYVAIVSR